MQSEPLRKLAGLHTASQAFELFLRSMPSGTGRDGMDGHRCRWNLETRAPECRRSGIGSVLEWLNRPHPAALLPFSQSIMRSTGRDTLHIPCEVTFQTGSKESGILWHYTACPYRRWQLQKKTTTQRPLRKLICGAKPWLKSPVPFGPLRLKAPKLLGLYQFLELRRCLPTCSKRQRPSSPSTVSSDFGILDSQRSRQVAAEFVSRRDVASLFIRLSEVLFLWNKRAVRTFPLPWHKNVKLRCSTDHHWAYPFSNLQMMNVSEASGSVTQHPEGRKVRGRSSVAGL